MEKVGRVKFVRGNYLPEGGILFYFQEKNVTINGEKYERLDTGYLVPAKGKSGTIICLSNLDYFKTPFGKVPIGVSSYAMLDGGLQVPDGKPDYFIEKKFNLVDIFQLWKKLNGGDLEEVLQTVDHYKKDADNRTMQIYNSVTLRLKEKEKH